MANAASNKAQGYTKHYFAGSERIATSIGGGGLCYKIYPVDVLTANELQRQVDILKYLPSYLTAQYEDHPHNEDINHNAPNELQYLFPRQVLIDINCSAKIEKGICVRLVDLCQRHDDDIPYYYHPDHLGGAAWITDQKGNPVQYLHYAPYGELIANQKLTSFDERYKFIGKERDQETGYDYFGARYYSSILHWLSVDPLADKYPWISPYAYCGWNPVKFIDPDGRDAILITFPNYRAEYKGLHLPYTGHSGVLLINNKNGLTKYYEYGRYGSLIGMARNKIVPNVKLKDGKPTLESLNKVLKYLSEKYGDKGNIEGAYIKSDAFDSMMNYAEGVCAEANNPEREPYDILKNNCATFAEDVITQDESIEKPTIFLPTPVNVVEEYQKQGNARVVYNFETEETSLNL